MRAPSGQGENLVDDLGHALALDLVTVGAMRVADPREQQAQVVVDFRHRPDRRPRVPAGALLIDADGRREAIDLVDVRLFHLAQELPGIGGQALDIAPLALGVDGVEGEAALATAGQTGDHHQPVAWQLNGDVL